MSAPAFTLFDTPVGRCAIAWGPRGILGVQLPEGPEPRTRARVLARFPGARVEAPPADVQRVVDDIAALLRGEPRALDAVPLDMSDVPPFHRRVYEVARTIPPGATATYGEVAARLGDPGAARAVGQALGRNPFAIVVPCHRVVAAGRKLGGFSARGGVATKLRLLALEAAPADRAPGFDVDAAVAHLRAADPALGRLIDRVGPFRLRLQTTPSLFAALAEAIVYQQLAPRAAATIHARLCAAFARGPRAARVHEGPTAEQILRAADETLRSVGLSGPKILALRDLARRTVDGELPTVDEAARLDDAALVERLTGVRGIGRWTAEMLLIFRLGRPDVLPVDDLGLRKGFAAAFRSRDLPAPDEVARRGERWRPYRTVASWYLWRAGEAQPWA